MGHLNNHGTLVHAFQMYSYMHTLLIFGPSILVYKYLQSQLVLVQLMFWDCYINNFATYLIFGPWMDTHNYLQLLQLDFQITFLITFQLTDFCVNLY